MQASRSSDVGGNWELGMVEVLGGSGGGCEAAVIAGAGIGGAGFGLECRFAWRCFARSEAVEVRLRVPERWLCLEDLHNQVLHTFRHGETDQVRRTI